LQGSKFTFSRIGNHSDSNGNQGSGWSNAGLEKYNELYYEVYDDRLKRSEGFFEEMVKYMNDKYGKQTIKKTKTPQLKTRVRAINDLQFKPPV